MVLTSERRRSEGTLARLIVPVNFLFVILDGRVLVGLPQRLQLGVHPSHDLHRIAVGVDPEAHQPPVFVVVGSLAISGSKSGWEEPKPVPSDLNIHPAKEPS